jgi:acyl-CoA dehydrogenase
MDFQYSDTVKGLQTRLLAFMDEHIYPNERAFFEEIAANRAAGNPWRPTRLIEELKTKARIAGHAVRAHPKVSLTSITHRCAKSWVA